MVDGAVVGGTVVGGGTVRVVVGSGGIVVGAGSTAEIGVPKPGCSATKDIVPSTTPAATVVFRRNDREPIIATQGRGPLPQPLAPNGTHRI